MPIKKHILKVETGNKITIPKTLCDALGISEGTALKVYSNGNNCSFTCEVPFSYENLSLLETYRQNNEELQQQNKQLQQSIIELKKKYNIGE